MDRQPPSPRAGFLARFENGPLSGSVQRLPSLPSGEPPEFVRVPGDEGGAYARAGDPRPDGTLPYWWVALSEEMDKGQPGGQHR